MDARRIEVLTTVEFGEWCEGDIVEVKVGSYLPRHYTGRITHIETLEFTIDASLLYTKKIEKIKYEDVIQMRRIIEPCAPPSLRGRP